jgi:hypothetical protein
MANNTWNNLLDPHPTARGAAFGTFTTAKDVSPTPLPFVTGYELKQGSVVELEAWGEYTCATGITLQLGFVYGVAAGAVASGGVTLAASSAITTGTTPTAWPWHMRWAGKVTAIGTTGVIYGSGILDLGTSLTVFSASAIPVTAAARSVTIDTTVQKTFGVMAAWGTSGAGNTLTVDVFNAKVVNQGKTQ